MSVVTPLIDSSLLSGKTILISGNTKGQVVFRGQNGGSSLLDWTSSPIWSPASLSLQNLLFENGQSVSQSNFLNLQGAGSNPGFGSLSFRDCLFRNIRVNNPSRGGLLSFSADVLVDLTLTDTAFIGIAPVTSGGLGSAIVWGPVAVGSSFKIRGPTTTVANPTALFRGCRSQRGGAISLQGDWGQQVDIQDTTFDANVADEAGGALSTISSLASSGNNSLSMFACRFTGNLQGTQQTANDGVNLGGGALALSQGSIVISSSGPSSTRPCVFSNNGFGTTAFSALATRGGTAIRVTAASLDGDTQPIKSLIISNCQFTGNQATMLLTNGSPLFVTGGANEFSTAMPVFSGNSFIGNAVLDPSLSAGGIFYNIPDSRSATISASTLSSTGTVYDVILASGSMIFAGNNTIGRISANSVGSSLSVPSGAKLSLIPPSRTDSLLLGSGVTLTNQGTIEFAEVSEINGSSGSVVSPGTLYISRNVTSTTPIALSSSSTLKFGVRSATDFGVLTMVGTGLAVNGALLVMSEGGYTPPEGLPFIVVRASPLSGSFVSSTCPSGSSCSVSVSNSGVTVANTPSTTPPSSSSDNTGAIVGGVIGGVVALALILLLVLCCVQRKRKQVRQNVSLPNPAFESNTSPRIRAPGNISPKGTERPRAGTLSGDPSADATLLRLAATSAPSGNASVDSGAK